ncbi:pVIII [red squirrel adenovirus 1]|uniref:Pre-hexon-linking protein VIII n=2 Tax=Squirrel mastadenovirus A TaxID=2170003 RepID=A0A220A484_9ADEN|nr:pVIII [red squirrel adenovirus 1]ARE31895.1 pVIII [red squirrel adenovirus 1]
MSKEIPTPYVWTFQPQMGAAAGASQDYSTRMNWLSAGNKMIQRVNDIRDSRNQILMRQAALTETPRNTLNPRVWPAALIDTPAHPPLTITLPDNELLEHSMTTHGMQLAGGGPIGRSPITNGCSGLGLQLNEQLPAPQPYRLRADGLFQLAGGSKINTTALSTPNLIALQTSPSVPRSGGIGSWQFVQEFVPAVYLNPYSGLPQTYPDEFIHNYDAYTDSVDGYD